MSGPRCGAAFADAQHQETCTMTKGLTVLLLFQLAGEVLAHLFSLPLPGPVIGMGLLFIALVLRGAVPAFLGDTSSSLLSHLSLLFVPAGVGVMLHFKRIGDEWLAIASALVLSTAVTVAVTALTLRALQRRRQRKDQHRNQHQDQDRSPS
jgi:holin-like protein